MSQVNEGDSGVSDLRGAAATEIQDEVVGSVRNLGISICAKRAEDV